MFPRLRARFRAFAAAEVREPTAMEIAATTPLTDDDFPADSRNPLKWADDWRAAALQSPPLLRCVSMVASECARLATSTIMVVDGDGVMSESERDLLNAAKMRESVDGGVSPAADFWRDAFSDLLTDGNALIIPTTSDGVLTSLRLMRAKTAKYQAADDAFYGEILGSEPSPIVRVPRSRVAHARMFGAPLAADGRGRQWPFSDSPIRLLGPTLGVSERIEDWIHRALVGPKGQLVISPKTGRLGGGQQKQMTLQVGAFLRGQKPLVTGGPVDVESFGQSAREADITGLRDYQLREVARVYGVPLPLIGSPVSAWGSGIEALAREYWKRAIAPRMWDVLSPLSHRLCRGKKMLVVDPLELIRGDSNDMRGMLDALRPNTGLPSIATLAELRRLSNLPALSAKGRAELMRDIEFLSALDSRNQGGDEDSGSDSEDSGSDTDSDSEEDETDGENEGENGDEGEMTSGSRGKMSLEEEMREMLAAM